MMCECNFGNLSSHSWDFIGTYFLTPWNCPYMKYLMALEFQLANGKTTHKTRLRLMAKPCDLSLCLQISLKVNEPLSWISCTVSVCVCVSLHVLELGYNSVTVVTSLQVGWPRNGGSNPSRGKASRPVLLSTLPPVQCVLGTFSLWLKQPRHQVDHALHYDWCHYMWTVFYVIIIILNFLTLLMLL